MMALVFADQLSRATDGERRLLHTLEKAFGDQASIVWLEPVVMAPHRTDFLLWSPSFGLLLIEVKDWSANAIYEATPERWKVLSKEVIESKENPALQAWNSLTKVMSKLKQTPELCHKDGDYKGRLLFPITHFVAFSNMTSSDFHQCPLKLGETMAEDCGLLFKEDIDFACSTKEQAQAFQLMLRRRKKPLFQPKLPAEAICFLQQAVRPVYSRPDLPPMTVVSEKIIGPRQSPRWKGLPYLSLPARRTSLRGVLTARVWAICLVTALACSFAAQEVWLNVSRRSFTESAPHLSLTATPEMVRPGHPVALRLSSSGYDRVKLDGRDVTPNGEQTITPSSTTRHFLVGFPEAGQVRSAIVTVRVSRLKSSTP